MARQSLRSLIERRGGADIPYSPDLPQAFRTGSASPAKRRRARRNELASLRRFGAQQDYLDMATVPSGIPDVGDVFLPDPRARRALEMAGVESEQNVIRSNLLRRLASDVIGAGGGVASAALPLRADADFTTELSPNIFDRISAIAPEATTIDRDIDLEDIPGFESAANYLSRAIVRGTRAGLGGRSGRELLEAQDETTRLGLEAYQSYMDDLEREAARKDELAFGIFRARAEALEADRTNFERYQDRMQQWQNALLSDDRARMQYNISLRDYDLERQRLAVPLLTEAIEGETTQRYAPQAAAIGIGGGLPGDEIPGDRYGTLGRNRSGRRFSVRSLAGMR